MQNFPEYKYDFSLEHDGSNRFMIWIIGCLIFIATLSMFAALLSKQMINDWRLHATNNATIEIPFNENIDEQALEIAEILAASEIIDSVELIPNEQTSALLVGMLGSFAEGLDTTLLPLPTLIEVNFRRAPTDTEITELENEIRAVEQNVRLLSHEEWASDILAYGEMLFLGSVILVVLMGSMTVLTLIWTLISRINIHRDEIEILTTIGADDRYIARQFQQFALSRTFVGCLIGLLAASITLLLVGLRIDLINVLDGFSISELVGWLLLPLGLCLLIAYCASRITLKRTLAELM